MKRLFVALALVTLSWVPLMAQEAALNSQLCRSQLDLLKSGNKLTADEIAVFEKQCACLESRERDGDAKAGSCAE